MIKILNKIGIGGIFLNLIKSIYKRPTANIILSGEKLETSTLRSGARQECVSSPLIFSIVLKDTCHYIFVQAHRLHRE